jgi:hypothetical protein
METGLFEIQADHLNGFRQARQVQQPLERLFYALFGRAESASFDRDAAPANITNGIESFAGSAPKSVDLPPIPPLSSRVAFCVSPICPTTRWIASSGMKTLWRQTGQILFALDALDCGKTQDRRRRFRPGIDLPAYGPRNVDLRALRSSRLGSRSNAD